MNTTPAADTWSIQGAMYSIPWILTILSVGTVGVRLYLRKKFAARIESDDWIMVAAVVLQIGYQSLVTVSVTKGVGRSISPTVTPADFTNMLMWSWFTNPLAVMVAVISRLSIAIVLIRIFGVRIWFKYFMIIFTGALALIGTLNFIIVWLQARPVEALWDMTMQVDRWDPMIQQVFSTVLHLFLAASDLTYALFPVAFVWKLNMPVRRKVGLSAVMALSIITFGIALAKLIMIINAIEGTNDVVADTDDVFYTFAVLTLITGIEANLVIIIGCVPKLRTIAKLNILTSFGSSLGSLFRGTRRDATKQSSSASSSKARMFHDHSGYSDLEMQPRLLRPDGANGLQVSASRNYPATHLVHEHEGKDIRRTDDFVITTNTVRTMPREQL